MEKSMENKTVAMDAILEKLDGDKEYQMKKQEILNEHEAQQKAEAPEMNWKEKALRATMRPLLHVMTEFMGMVVLAGGMMLSIIATLLIAMYVVVWAANTAGIEPNSVQSGILAVAACSTAIYAFFVESKRALKKLRSWTDMMHNQIEGI